MFHASMRCASISATAHASECSLIRAASSVRRSPESFFESSRPTMRRLGLRITAAATTGPNSAPRPASSMPAMRIQPSWRAARSKRVEQSRLIAGNFSTSRRLWMTKSSKYNYSYHKATTGSTRAAAARESKPLQSRRQLGRVARDRGVRATDTIVARRQVDRRGCWSLGWPGKFCSCRESGENSMRLWSQSVLVRAGFSLSCTVALLVPSPSCVAQGLASSDLSGLRSVGSVELSPDGRHIAYTVTMRDRPGRPYGQLWIMDATTQKSVRVGGEKDSGGGPRWSPDGKWFAFQGHQGEKGRIVHSAAGRFRGHISRLAERHQQPTAGHRQRCDLVARRQTTRVHLFDSRPGSCRSRRRPHGD